MEEEITEEIMKKISGGKILKEEEKTLIKVLINICKYYKINNVETVVKYIKRVLKI